MPRLSRPATPRASGAPSCWAGRPSASPRSRWALREPPARPPARENALLAYDAARAQVVLFGGGLGVNLRDQELRDTWTWDGTTWTEGRSAAVPTRSAIPGQAGAVMAYDPASRTVLLYELTAQKPATVAAAAYDEARGRVVALVGPQGGGPWQTWSWDGTTWSLLQPAHAPSRAAVSRLFYDSRSNRVVAFQPGRPGGQAWTWDGSDWSPGAIL